MALVAQLDRVLPSEGKGREFESRQVRHIKISTQMVGIFICCTRWDENSRSDVRNEALAELMSLWDSPLG